MSMATHIDLNAPRYRDAAAQILSRHDALQPEANITSAVRDFLTATSLARSEEIIEENPPSDGSRRAVDLTALDTFIEFKRRVGTAAGGEPDPENVQQLDEYLEQSASQGRIRLCGFGGTPRATFWHFCPHRKGDRYSFIPASWCHAPSSRIHHTRHLVTRISRQQ